MCNIHPLLVELNNLSNNESEIQDLVIRSLQSLSFNSYKKIIDKVDFNQNEKLYNTLEIFTFYNGNLCDFWLKNGDLFIKNTNKQLILKIIQISLVNFVLNDAKNFNSKISFNSLIEYLKLMELFPNNGNYNGLLEIILIKVSIDNLIDIVIDNPTNSVIITDFKSRDIYDGIKKLKILKQDQVFAKSPIMENLIRFKKIKLAKAIKNLEVNTDEEVVVAPDMNELIKKLIKRNLNEINSLVDYEGKFNQCEEAVNDKAESISKSRKRKVGE